MFLDHDAAGWTVILLTWYLQQVLYTAITFGVCKLAAAAVEEVSVGYGPTPIRWQRGGTMFRLGPLPVGAYVKLLNENSDRSLAGKRFHELPLATRLGMHLVGHLIVLGVGIAILSFAPSDKVWVQAGLLVTGIAVLNLLPLPSLAGGRAIHELWVAATYRGPQPPPTSTLFIVSIVLTMPVAMALLAALLYLVLVRYEDLIAWLAAMGMQL